MLHLLHLSDLHFGPPYVEQVGEALLRQADELDIDAIVVSGDFTQRARAEQFEEARDFLERLPDVPRLVVPGNHDIPLWRIFDRIFRPRQLYKEYISDDLNPVLRLDNAVIVGIDSTCPRRAVSNGRIHRYQIEHAEEVFRQAPADAVRIVVAHHHFAPAPDYEKDQTMPKARRALDRFVKAGVEMILGGHLHRAYVGNSLDVYPGKDRDRGIIIVQSGTSTSRRGRAREQEKNSFNLIRIDEQTHRVTHYLYDDSDDSFSPMSRHIFPRPCRKLTPPT